METVFADAPLCDAVDACRAAYAAAVAAAADETTRRMLTRIARLELLELLATDLERIRSLPVETPAALHNALMHLLGAMTVAPELERAHCASAVAAQASAPPSDGWPLSFIRAENGPTCPIPCEGTFVVAFRPHLGPGSADAVLRRLMPLLAAAAGQPPSCVRMRGADGEDVDEFDEFDGPACAEVVAPNDGRTLIEATIYGGDREHEFEIVVHSGAGVSAEAVCQAARASTRPAQACARCDVMLHGTTWQDGLRRRRGTPRRSRRG